jgi:hypothetical protein
MFKKKKNINTWNIHGISPLIYRISPVVYAMCPVIFVNPLTNLHQSPQMRCVDNRRLFTYKHLQLGKIPVQVQPSVSSSMAGKSSMF